MTPVVAAISQPLRAPHCIAQIGELGPGTMVHVLTADRTPFWEFSLSQGVTIHEVAPPPGVLPTSRFSMSRMSRRISAWARGGSTLGARVQAWIRSTLWRLRYLDRLYILLGRRRQQKTGPDQALATAPILFALRDIHEETPIGLVLVFDLFDLPAVMAFAEEHQVEVMVA